MRMNKKIWCLLAVVLWACSEQRQPILQDNQDKKTAEEKLYDEAVEADELRARLAVNRAIVLSEKKQRNEAAQAYRQFLNYNYAKTDNGLIVKAVYLESAERWDELEQMQTTLRIVTFENARQVIDTLKGAVDRHRNGADPNDDLTMMCIRMN